MTVTGPIDPSIIDKAARIVVAAPSAIPGVGELTGLADGALAARRWLTDRHNWVRVLWVVTGFSLIVTGGILLVRRPAAQVVGRTVKDAVEA